MNAVLVVARLTVSEAWRKRLLLTVAGLSLVFVGLYLYGVHLLVDALRSRAIDPMDPASVGQQGFSSLEFLAMYVVNFLGGLMGALAAVGTIASEVDSGLMQAIVPKPITRASLVFGKWLGYEVLTSVYLWLLAGSMIAGTTLISGYTPPSPLPALALMNLNALLLLTLTVLGSCLLSTLANGIVVVLLYGMAWAGGLLQAIGELTRTHLLSNLGQASVFLLPSDALWRGASYYLQPEWLLEVERQAPVRINPFAGMDPPAAWLIVYAAAFLLAALLGAVAAFNRRDL
ncbi:MAG TPA: ABC transporter permease [Deinococcales bacterium]|nr:ABC transporter permease [Deinococcales bacterium]